MCILTFKNAKNANILKNPPPFSKVNVYRHCEIWRIFSKMHCEFSKMRKIDLAHFQKLMFTGIENFYFRKCKKCEFFKNSAAHFQKLMFTGIVNSDFRKCEKYKFFKESAAHFQKLMFTGIVNFDFQKCKNCEFLKNPLPIFKS